MDRVRRDFRFTDDAHGREVPDALRHCDWHGSGSSVCGHRCVLGICGERVVSFHVVSRHLVSSHVMSRRVVSARVGSCRVMS